MDKLSELYDMLCVELEKITDKGELTAGSLEAVGEIVDILKDIEELGYSGDYRHDMSYRRSYARRGNARRDNMGRYSSERGYSRNYSMDPHELVDQLEDIMHSAPNEKSRMEIEKLITRLERM